MSKEKDLCFLSEQLEFLLDTVDISNLTMDSVLDTVRKTLILDSLERNRYQQTKTAEQLGMNRGTLRKYMKEYGLI